MDLYNVDPYILDSTKMDMIGNSDNEENRQEVVDLLSVSMHAMLMAAFRWKIKKFELKESCELHGFNWSDVDAIMRFWCQIDKSRLHDDLIEEWNGDDEQSCDCATCVQQSSSVQPASSKICSNVGKGPQQPSIAEDNARMLEEVADPSPPGNNITDGVVCVQSSSSPTSKEDKKEVDEEKMMVDNDESSSLQTLINPEASLSSTSAETLPETSSSSAETTLLATSSSSAEITLPATSSSSAEIALPATSSNSAEAFLPATSSSSAESSLLATSSSFAEIALAATSSNANSSCTDIMDTVILSSDYNQIANIADQIFSDIGAVNFS